MSESSLSERLAKVRATIANHQRLVGLSGEVRIVAVTKTHGPEAVRAAQAAGLGMVGENRVQEALDKQDHLADANVEWHLIGSVQRRKVRQLIGRFSLIHSIDRLELAEELQARSTGSTQAILVQVNCSSEPQKGGVSPEGLLQLLDEIRPLKRVRVDGLMTMAAYEADEIDLRQTFGLLRKLRDRANSDGHQLTELSMGMSDDYPMAVEEGATMLRLGSILFGPRTTFHGAG